MRRPGGGRGLGAALSVQAKEEGQEAGVGLEDGEQGQRGPGPEDVTRGPDPGGERPDHDLGADTQGPGPESGGEGHLGRQKKREEEGEDHLNLLLGRMQRTGQEKGQKVGQSLNPETKTAPREGVSMLVLRFLPSCCIRQTDSSLET